MELYSTPKSQHTTVKHSQQLFEHTYTSDLYGLGTLTPIEFFKQDLLWQSSNTNSHSCSQKVSKHTLGQSIVGLSVHLHTTTSDVRRKIFRFKFFLEIFITITITKCVSALVVIVMKISRKNLNRKIFRHFGV
jgi:hypothetical protein